MLEESSCKRGMVEEVEEVGTQRAKSLLLILMLLLLVLQLLLLLLLLLRCCDYALCFV